MNISYFATQWFITMFSYDLELSQVNSLCLFVIKINLVDEDLEFIFHQRMESAH